LFKTFINQQFTNFGIDCVKL